MSTRSGPNTFSAEVLVSQPVTASTWPVSRGVMSAPIGTMLTLFSSILFLASSALSRMMPVDWMPIFLPTMSWALRMGFFLSEKKQYGCFCTPTAKHLIGSPCDTASMSDGLDETCPRSKRPEATTATPSMFGPPGWISKSIPSCAK